jgi:hypothetical protein
MPKKMRPKYGVDPVQEIPALSFTEEETVHLLNELGVCSETSREIVIARLMKTASQYLWLRNQYREKSSVAQQNAALKDIADLARELGAGLDRLQHKLSTMDMDAEWLLSLRAPHLSHLTEQTAYMADELTWLADRGNRAWLEGKVRSGPHRRVAVYRTVAELASIYEEFSGKPLSHNPKKKTIYDGRPHSQAGSFIVAFFDVVDSTVSHTSISTAIASIVRSGKARNEPAPVEGTPPPSREQTI